MVRMNKKNTDTNIELNKYISLINIILCYHQLSEKYRQQL